MGRCQYCGATIKDTDAFCIMCGKPTGAQVPSQKTPQGAVGVTPVRPQGSSQSMPKGAVGVRPVQTKAADQMDQERTVSAWPAQAQVPSQSDSEQTRSKLMLPAILLAIALCGVGVVFLFQRGNGVGAGGAAPASSEGAAGGASATVTVTFLGGGAQEGSTSPFTCSEGDTITLPICGFSREGYVFDCWEDNSGHLYAPGTQIVVEGDMSFSAVWVTADVDSAGEPATDGADGKAETETDDKQTPSFPRYWSGTFEGYSQHVEGGTYDTSVKFTLSTIESGGRLAGICYIGFDDPEARSGSYRVEGQVEWTTGKITLSGTAWEDQGDLEYMRSFSGTVNSDYTSITGMSQRTDGSHQGYWNMHADR